VKKLIISITFNLLLTNPQKIAIFTSLVKNKSLPALVLGVGVSPKGEHLWV